MNNASFSFLIILSVGLLSSCYDANNTYGENLVNSSFRNITTDTITVTVTAVFLDSLETSAKNVVLVGQYTHPVWGKITASSYIPYTRPTFGTDIEETVILDSLVLSLYYNGSYVGDTMPPQQLSVHRLLEKVALNDNGYLYSNSSFPYDSEPLGSCTFRPKPGRGDKLTIRLSDRLGQDLLTRLHTSDESVSSDRFEDYFKGIVLVPEMSVSRSLLSFSVSDTMSALVLHYHVVSEQDEEQTVIFAPNTDTQFNHIDHDRTGTLMEPYPVKHVEIPSVSLDNRGLLFSGIGWYSRLEFPFLNTIMQQGERVEIQSAYLKIYPEQQTYSSFNALPDSIFLYIADQNNVVTDAVTDYLGTQVQGGVLVKDDTFDEKTYYYFDVSQFMKEELGTFGKYKHNLQLVFSEDDYTGTFKNMTFSDQQGRSPIVLQLIYKVYESN